MVNWKKRLYNSYVSTGQSHGKEPLKSLDDVYFDQIIKEKLPENKNIKIVDLACGTGKLLYSLKKHGYNNILGVDISKEQINIAHEFGLRDEARCEDLNIFLKETENGTFDVVFLMDVLEHFEKGQLMELLDNVSNIIKKDGILILHVPNALGIFGMRVMYGDLTHEVAFTVKSLQQLLSVCNFKNIVCYEDTPVVVGLKSMIRLILWKFLTSYYRLLFKVEVGLHEKPIFSQNILATALKDIE